MQSDISRTSFKMLFHSLINIEQNERQCSTNWRKVIVSIFFRLGDRRPHFVPVRRVFAFVIDDFVVVTVILTDT